MTLVDTSVWIDHLQHTEQRLFDLLQWGQVYSHAYVAGELAMGHCRQRKDLLRMHTANPQAPLVEPHELFAFVSAHQLYGRGIGYMDAHLLASMQLMENVQLWTRDKHLFEVARRLKLPILPKYTH